MTGEEVVVTAEQPIVDVTQTSTVDHDRPRRHRRAPGPGALRRREPPGRRRRRALPGRPPRRGPVPGQRRLGQQPVRQLVDAHARPVGAPGGPGDLRDVRRRVRPGPLGRRQRRAPDGRRQPLRGLVRGVQRRLRQPRERLDAGPDVLRRRRLGRDGGLRAVRQRRRPAEPDELPGQPERAGPAPVRHDVPPQRPAVRQQRAARRASAGSSRPTRATSSGTSSTRPATAAVVPLEYDRRWSYLGKLTQQLDPERPAGLPGHRRRSATGSGRTTRTGSTRTA